MTCNTNDDDMTLTRTFIKLPHRVCRAVLRDGKWSFLLGPPRHHACRIGNIVAKRIQVLHAAEHTLSKTHTPTCAIRAAHVDAIRHAFGTAIESIAWIEMGCNDGVCIFLQRSWNVFEKENTSYPSCISIEQAQFIEWLRILRADKDQHLPLALHHISSWYSIAKCESSIYL